MKTKKSLSAELQQDIQTLDDLEEKAAAMVNTSFESDLWLSTDEVKEIREEMKKPDWQGVLEHELVQVEGTRLAIRVKAGFELSMTNLIKENHKTRHTQVDGLVEALEAQGGENEEIRDIVSEALLPRTSGLTTTIEVAQGKILADISDYETLRKNCIGPIEVFVQKELVRFDYSDFLEAVVDERFVIDREKMSKHIWIPVVNFSKGKKIVETFSWKDGTVSHMAELRLEKK